MEPLEKAGLHLDDLQKLRVAHPDLTDDSQELQKHCGTFEEHLDGFRKAAQSLITLSDRLSMEVDREKVKALGASSQLNTVASAREREQQQLQGLALEKLMQLERLKVECESLSRAETEQNEFMDQFALTK